MTRVDRLRVGDALRQLLGAPALYLQDPPRRGATIQVGVQGSEAIVGTVEEVSDEDGRSWVLTVVIGPEDLPPEQPERPRAQSNGRLRAQIEKAFAAKR